MTTANKITIVRILLVPFFIVQVLYYERSGAEWNRWLALLAFAVASISDGVDGYIARRYNQRSELGVVLDPLADKLLLVSGIVLLSLENPHLGKLPLWLTATIVSREVLLIIGLFVILHVCGKVASHPRFLSKAATVLQMITVLWLLLKWRGDWAHALAVAATICTGISGLLYVHDGVQQLNASPSSAPTPRQ